MKNIIKLKVFLGGRTFSAFEKQKQEQQSQQEQQQNYLYGKSDF